VHVCATGRDLAQTPSSCGYQRVTLDDWRQVGFYARSKECTATHTTAGVCTSGLPVVLHISLGQ
jgi:hypothetical protein